MKKYLYHSLVLLLALLCTSAATAQMSVSGKVTDDKNEALIGVSVVAKGTTNGAITDLDGMYKIDIKSGKQVTLVFTFVGYASVEQNVTTSGKVDVSMLAVKVGSEVKRGERLFFLNSREAAAAYTDYLEESKDLELAIKTQRMAKDLFDHQAGSRIAVEQSQRDVEKGRVRMARAEEALHILGLNPAGEGKLDPRIPVLSTRSGTVIERKVTEGEYVQPEHDPLMVISDLSTLWALADIFEHDMRHVHPGQRALVRTAAYPDKVFTAQVSYIAQVIDSETRTVKVRFTVANPSHNLKPEMFASVRLFLNESEKSFNQVVVYGSPSF